MLHLNDFLGDLLGLNRVSQLWIPDPPGEHHDVAPTVGATSDAER